MFSFLKRQKNALHDQASLAAALVGVAGQINKRELFTLYSYALQLRQRAVAVEIGSYKGKSALALGLGARRVGARVDRIDPHDAFVGVAGGVFGPGDLKDKIRHIHTFDLGDVVFPICLSSTSVAQIWDKPVDLLWIDGDHTYEVVSKDFLGFSPHVVPGGVIILHDREMKGVARLISEIDSSVFEKINTLDAMAIYRKR